MKFQIEKTISNFVQNQFPQFYQEEGPNFILFMQAYYEWMESYTPLVDSSNNVIINDSNSSAIPPVYGARNLFDYRDIDNTLNAFLTHFQDKYLYGIPFNIITNPRFLLKHIKDVYGSKGSIHCYKLLFKLIYNQDIEVYLPGTDILKPSDGTWSAPKYLEVTDNGNLGAYINQTIVGVSSGTRAIVESLSREAVNMNVVNTLYISNIQPPAAGFVLNEKLVLAGQTTNSAAVSGGASVLGSLDYVNILSGGSGFKIGDTLKIAHNNLVNNQIISFGTEGYLKVTNVTSSGLGQLGFSIINGGFGFNTSAQTFTYRGIGDTTGSNAGFSVGSVNYLQNITYNTDIIGDYIGLTINAASLNFTGNPTGNANSTIGSMLSFTNSLFGSVSSLTNTLGGNAYTNNAITFVRNVELSNILAGNLTYSTSSNTITGYGTTFTNFFSANDVVFLQANSFANTQEYQVIKSVVNSTSITLYGPPTFNSSNTGIHRMAPSIMPANFAPYDAVMARSDGTIDGLNATVLASPSVGSNIVSQAVAIGSGKAYVAGETVTAYLYGQVTMPTIINGGRGYSNGDVIVFSNGGASSQAKGFVTTNSNGTITSVGVTLFGSGYTSIPAVRVQSKGGGTGALLTTTITQSNPLYYVTGQVVKGTIGRQRGSWTTTRGFLNSDKYIQDSYFYQDYSYQIKVASTLDKYKSILYDTFHSSGSELFGQFLLIDTEQSIENTIYNSLAREIFILGTEMATGNGYSNTFAIPDSTGLDVTGIAFMADILVDETGQMLIQENVH